MNGGGDIIDLNSDDERRVELDFPPRKRRRLSDDVAVFGTFSGLLPRTWGPGRRERRRRSDNDDDGDDDVATTA